MQRVFVLDKHKQALMPCHPARARTLLKAGQAAVYRRYPFTIILKEREGGDVQLVQFKVDPGAKTSGLALVGGFQRGWRCLWAAELKHRGRQIRDNLLKRRQVRRSRRNRKTRYRQARFDNRCRPANWLPPSLQSPVDNVLIWVKRLTCLAPLSALAMELVRFDTQKLQNPEISGIEYQQGELLGYEIREYLLEKWGHKCAYCGVEHVPLTVEHINPKARGGSNRVSNLTIACMPCNKRKGTQTAAEFGYPHIQALAKQPLRDAAAINATRWVLSERLQATGMPVEVGTGGRTKFNRVRQGYPKTHWLDAVCVGQSGGAVFAKDTHPLLIEATGRQARQMCRMDKYGFPRTTAKRNRLVKGFQTGDMVKAVVTKGKKVGTYIGRVAVRASGGFNITGASGTIEGIGWRYYQLLQRVDGYKYKEGGLALPPRT